ncbi:MAG TPA: hypothetical protein ENH05_04030 [Rhizobiales bacterium]|nr:hypothetical protein BMS3Bbin10_02400 [bacterium BMS3Bbin10]HDO51887.1 hypothetical protein [Hyphomicrobiales bacterium]
MSKSPRGKGAEPGASASDARHQRWVTRAYVFAGACLFALAMAEFFDFATPRIQTILMLGIVAAGTAAWILQAKRKCPNCRQPYGYHFRLVKANMCHKCGADFPKWLPGEDDDEDKGK